MALIGRIRKNFWFVLLVLGLALAAFVIMDMVNAGNRGGLGPQQLVGEVAGQKIDYQDFQKVEQALYSNASDNLQAKTSVWNYLVEKAIVDKQADALGLAVTRDELMDLQFGTNLSPVIQNTFRNPQTGQVDMQQLLSIKQAIEAGEELSPSFRLSWSEQEKQIKKIAKQDKLTNMVAKAMYTPTFAVETLEANNNATASFDYVKIPFDNIDDSEVTLTDDDYRAYINENKFKYTNDYEQRVVVYAVKDVLPTSADSAKWRSQLQLSTDKFAKKTRDQDSLHAINNQGFVSPIFASADQITGPLADNLSGLAVGDVFGPYREGGYYISAKLLDKAIVADSASARHILRNVANGDPTQLAAANSYIDSLENLIRSGKSTMEELAPTDSQDPGSSFKGGDLGTFTQGAMVPAFNNAVFYGSKEGGLYKVQTQFGVHLIQVDKKIYNNRDSKYKFAYIRVPITPSQGTQDDIYDEISEIVDAARDLPALQAAIEQRPDLTLETAAPLRENDYLFSTFGSDPTSREIVKWAFDQDVEVGEVSPSVYTYTDKVNYYNNKYVITALKSISAPGLATVADVKLKDEIAVTNWKKGQMLAAKITSSDLESVASSHNATVQTATDVRFSSSSVPGIGNEPKVIAAAHGQEVGAASTPIVGSNGVYVVKTNARTPGAVTASIPTARKNITSTNRGRAGFSLMNALKEMFKPTDNRSKYF